MDEQELLHQILDQWVPVQEVKDWLDETIEDAPEAQGERPADKISKFKQYDPMSFVVVVLNFLREDTAPLLTPGERLQTADTPSSAAVVQEDRRTEGRAASLAQGGPSPVKAFDISSAQEFPSLAPVDAPLRSRGATKQRRRIRPTTVSESDKPIEGDITVFGASPAPSWGRMDDTATRRLPLHAPRFGHLQNLVPSLEAVQQPRSATAPTCKDTHVVDTDGQLATNPDAEHDEIEEGCGGAQGGMAHLREATSGSISVQPTRSARRGRLEQYRDRSIANQDAQSQGEMPSTPNGHPGDSVRGQHSTTDRVRSQAGFVPITSAAGDATPTLLSSSQAAVDFSPRTPTKPLPQISRSGGPVSSCNDYVPQTPPFKTPTAASTGTAEETSRRRSEPILTVLASLYVHIMVRRLVPSLATEMHLTVRLLHVHSNVVRASFPGMLASDCHREQFSPMSSVALNPAVAGMSGKCAGGESRLGACTEDPPEVKTVFKTGLDCRSFAASVLLGLKSLLPHIGTDTLDLLAGSLALASESEERIEEARQVVCQARGDGVKAGGKAGKALGQQNVDDTAIVQNVGAPFAALQWREEDSAKNYRTSSGRALFQNRQESVDRFGSLLRNYQGSKKGLQQGAPATILQDLRMAASALIGGLASENLGWLAQYFSAQLVGWGLAPPEETDSDLMALVAPAGEKGLATLQKLHRRISTSSSGEGGNASKSSHKLRHPVMQSFEAKSKQYRVPQSVGGIRGPRTSGQQLRPRKSSGGPRQSKAQNPESNPQMPAAPLQLGWFPGNQEFFYHFLLVLDSHTFNSHLKVQLVAEISRLYHQQTSFEPRRKEARGDNGGEGRTTGGDNSTTGKGVRGFTGTMVKLKVLAKFVGLLTFSPNWGVPVSEVASFQREALPACTDRQAYMANCPLPLGAYLDHAWSTEGLVGAVPWIADFLRMMKWDELSAQTEFYRSILGMLASLHAQPCMRPEHPAFTECLLAVSCEVETLFQDLGSDLCVQCYRLSFLSSIPTACFLLGSSGMLGPRQPRDGGYQLSAIFARQASKPKAGSLDAEVVLSRRLIQNCCPYLEDVLTLIGSLDRAWKLGVAHGGDGTPLRANRSPRGIGATGVSPRGRRVIKPHQLRALPVLPSVPEQQRGESQGKDTGTEQEISHTESARLRLVDTFFHSLPDELQVTADFVVRRAVQNACEETLAVMVKPAVAATISRLQASLKEFGKTGDLSPGHGRFTQSTLPTDGSTEGNRLSSRHKERNTRLERWIVWTTAALQENIGSKARLFAGRKGNAIATTATLSLVSCALPLRVCETVAAIAGRHAQQAAERKIQELAAATMSEAVLACHVDMERELKDASQTRTSRHPGGVEHVRLLEGKDLPVHVRPDRGASPSWLLRGLLPKSPVPNAPSLVSALLHAAQDLGIGARDKKVWQAVSRVAASSNGDGAQAVTIIIRETLHLVRSIRSRHRSNFASEESTEGVEDTGLDLRVPGKCFPRQEEGGKPDTLRLFLALIAEVWGSFYHSSGNYRDSMVQALRHGFASTETSTTLFDDLVNLAAVAWQTADFSKPRSESHAERSCTTEGGQNSWLHNEGTAQEDYPPWAPALELISWEVIPPLTAETALISFIQLKSMPRRQGGRSEATKRHAGMGLIADPSRDAIFAIATAVARGYHSVAVRKDLSAVLLADLSDAAAKSLTGMRVEAKPSSFYHPMNLCRLVALLVIG